MQRFWINITVNQAIGFHTLPFNGHNGPQHENSEMIHDLNEIKNFL